MVHFILLVQPSDYLISPNLHLMKLHPTDFVTNYHSFQGRMFVIWAEIC